MNTRISAGIVVYRLTADGKDFELLLVRAAKEREHWTPPKGHVDPGESELEAAIRETNEETGLSQQDLELVDGFRELISYDAKRKPKRVIYFLARLKTEKDIVISDEHQDWAWVSTSRAIEMTKHHETVSIIDRAHEFLSRQIGSRIP